MKSTLRGRPRLNLKMSQILEAVRRHRQVMAAATELRCSDAFIFVRFKRAALTLREVLEAQNVEELLRRASPTLIQNGEGQPCPK